MTFEDDILINNGDDKLTPYEHLKENKWHHTLGYVLIILALAGVVGVLVWLILLFEDEKQYHCEQAKQIIDSDFTIYKNRAAEPYNGEIKEIKTGSSVETCKTSCDTIDCKFFTYHNDLESCYLYESGIIPYQHSDVALIGPTNINADVYVKSGEKVSELVGVNNVDQFKA
jgi:hypothetical protein